jgi:curli biogenesis system outer membrane secretion channel CsgG
MQKQIFLAGLLFVFVSCTTQQQIIPTVPQVQQAPAETAVMSLKRKVAIARFSNETEYAKGVFYDKNNDPVGRQAVDILSTKLASTGKFLLLERQDLDKIMEEMKVTGQNGFQNVGADYIIVGSVTEFGRKNVGDVNAFSRTKTQTVQAGVSIRLIDVSTGQIIYSEEAKGEAETTNKTVLGYGERTDYDATLSDKAISAAISKLVENVITNCMDRPGKSYILSFDANGLFISGGARQGVKANDEFNVMEKGKEVVNPQTGMKMELPGRVVGRVKVVSGGGDTVENEYSLVTLLAGTIDPQRIQDYIITEIR